MCTVVEYTIILFLFLSRGKSLLESWGTTFLLLSLSDLLRNHMNIAMLLEHMHKKFEVIRTKIKGGCQSGTKMVTHESKNDLFRVFLR